MANMPNLRGLLSVTLAGRMAHPAVILAILMFSGLLLYCAIRVWQGFQGGEQGFNLRFSVTLMITMLVSYHFYIHDLSILALPLVLVVNHLAKSKDACSARRYGLLLITVLSLISLAHICFFAGQEPIQCPGCRIAAVPTTLGSGNRLLQALRMAPGTEAQRAAL